MFQPHIEIPHPRIPKPSPQEYANGESTTKRAITQILILATGGNIELQGIGLEYPDNLLTIEYPLDIDDPLWQEENSDVFAEPPLPKTCELETWDQQLLLLNPDNDRLGFNQ